MGEMIAFGLDVAKHVFQVQGVDDQVSAAFRCKLRRSEILEFFGKLRGCPVGLEACATAHYWAQEIRALGHQVRLTPPC
jgi:transposase